MDVWARQLCRVDDYDMHFTWAVDAGDEDAFDVGGLAWAGDEDCCGAVLWIFRIARWAEVIDQVRDDLASWDQGDMDRRGEMTRSAAVRTGAENDRAGLGECCIYIGDRHIGVEQRIAIRACVLLKHVQPDVR